MATLLDLKARSGLTNEEVGRALGVSRSTAGDILHGRHIQVISDAAIQQLADALGITFERAWLAMEESANQVHGTPGRRHQRASEIRMQAELVLKVRMPELAITVSTPRPMTVVEADGRSLEMSHDTTVIRTTPNY